MLVATFTMASIPVAGAVTDQAPTQLPPPVAGKTVNASGQGGQGPLPAARHQRFVELTDPQQLPIGTTFDTTAGRVTLTSAADTKGGTQHAWFYEGIFKIGQTKGSKPITTLRSPRRSPSCPKACGRASAAAKKK